jgi:hypothetical protein
LEATAVDVIWKLAVAGQVTAATLTIQHTYIIIKPVEN